MRRAIVCPLCKPRPLGIDQNTDPLLLAEIMATGETTKTVSGYLRAGAMCDTCGRAMDRGDRAIAVSTSTNAHPYFKWEGTYLKPEGDDQ